MITKILIGFFLSLIQFGLINSQNYELIPVNSILIFISIIMIMIELNKEIK